MKNFAISFFFGFVFFVVFLVGFSFGVSLRPVSRLPERLVEECTCVPCLPDKFCRKCGHKSRDCPKLAWYFNHATNVSSRLTVFDPKIRVRK